MPWEVEGKGGEEKVKGAGEVERAEQEEVDVPKLKGTLGEAVGEGRQVGNMEEGEERVPGCWLEQSAAGADAPS
jgi:hypothetical protein